MAHTDALSWFSLPGRIEAAAGSSMRRSSRRAALRTRRANDALGEGPLDWLDADSDALAFRRTAADGSAVVCVLNLGEGTVRLPSDWGTEVLIASSDDVAVLATDEGAETVVVGAETALWLSSES